MPIRQTSRLHTARVSIPGARYFVTVCTAPRRTGLDRHPLTDAILQAAQQSDCDRDTETCAFNVMPDHVHWLFVLGGRLSLGRVMARFKARTRAFLASRSLSWQRDFFEHRLYPEESTEDCARYIYLNPYRGGCVMPTVPWPGWWCPRPDELRFLALLDADGTPPTEWMAESIPPGLKAMHGDED